MNTVSMHVNVSLTKEELKLLAGLASDQLFRREFIDPKMPGYKVNPGELQQAKALVERLRSMLERYRPGGAGQMAARGMQGVTR